MPSSTMRRTSEQPPTETGFACDQVDALVSKHYDELCRIGKVLLRHESHANGLTPAGLVHEAYLRVVERPGITERGHRYFFGAVVRAMRCVLLDSARRRSRLKRGGGVGPLTLNESLVAANGPSSLPFNVDRALEALVQVAERPAQVVKWRFLRGLSVDQTATKLGVTARTVKRDWRFARHWLHQYFTNQS